MNDISVFLPLRAGSRRVVNKNTRPLHPDGRSLFQIKIDQVSRIADHFIEVVISTNDPEVISQFPSALKGSNVRIERRPDKLCSSNTKVQDLIDYVPTVTRGSHIFWMHVTSPFVDDKHYLHALELYNREVLSGRKDSLMSVNLLQQFIWSDREGRVINADRDTNPWPNTQDLEPLYEINHAFYINSRDNYYALGDRVGTCPALYICNGLQRVDIDWQSDFELAQRLMISANALES